MECLGIFLDWLATHAPTATALVAGAALLIAWRSLQSQRETARKRAALDVFFKTEMDAKLMDVRTQYKKARSILCAAEDMSSFRKTQEYISVLAMLNIHELIAVGIRQGVLDEEVCYGFWGDILIDHYTDCKKLIRYEQENDGGTPYTFIDLQRIGERWKARAIAARERAADDVHEPPG